MARPFIPMELSTTTKGHVMSIPQKTKELRQALDNVQLFTLHIPGSRGYIHQLRVMNPVVSQTACILVLVHGTEYCLFGEGYDDHRYKTVDETVEKIRRVLESA